MYYVYVVELTKRVYSENKRFREANPQFNGVLQCLYVGMTSKTPKQRFLQHKEDSKSQKGYSLASPLVRKYGMYLRPNLYNHLNPITSREEALDLEKKLTLYLRRQGYAVWSN